MQHTKSSTSSEWGHFSLFSTLNAQDPFLMERPICPYFRMTRKIFLCSNIVVPLSLMRKTIIISRRGLCVLVSSLMAD